MAIRRLLPLAFLLALLAGTVRAQTVVLTPSTTTLSSSGGTITFNVNLSYSTTPTVLAVSVYLPAGWTYVSGSGEPTLVKPTSGDTTDSTHPLGWVYETTPTSSTSFSFTIAYPANVLTGQSLLSQIITRETSTSTATTISGTPVLLTAGANTPVWLGGAGSWADASQWKGGVVPNNSGEITVFSAEVSAGTSTIPAGTNISLNSLLRNGGTISGPSSTLSLTGNGSVWNSGTFAALSQLVIGSTADLTVASSANHDFDGTVLRNDGQILWQDGGALRSGNGGRLENDSGGTIVDANAGAAAISNGFGGTFSVQNNGLWIKAGTGTTSVRVPFTNNSTLEINAGTMEFTSAFTQTSGSMYLATGTSAVFGAGASFNNPNGFLAGGGSITGNVTNAGFLSPGDQLGQLMITGNLTLLDTSVLLLEINGKTTGAYDSLNVTGTVTLGGTLLLEIGTNAQTAFLPGDTLTIINASSLSGTFSNVPNGTRVFSTGSYASFILTYTGTGVVLSNFSPVPEPSTWALLLTGGTVLVAYGLRRKRR